MSPLNKKSQTEIERLATIAQVADRLQVSERTVRRWIIDGDLVGHLLGRQWRIAPEDLRTFLKLRRMG